jgi:hypothetical protein
MRQSPDPHRGHRFPAEVIAHAVWLYHVFNLRDCVRSSFWSETIQHQANCVNVEQCF